MNKLALVLIIFWLLAVLLGRLLGIEPNTVHLPAILSSPSMQFWLGTDELGRSLAARVLRGVEVSLWVAVSVTVVTISIGTLLGVVAGFYGGWCERLLMGVTEVFLAFPGFLLAVALAAVLGAGLGHLVLALCVTGWVNYARLARGQTILLCHAQHVMAARTLGASDIRLMVKHILPLLASLLVVEATYGIASVMVSEASLSFLGLGVQPPNPSWGVMLRDAVRYMLVAPHYVLVVGMAMMSIIFSVNVLGDTLRDSLDVREVKR